MSGRTRRRLTSRTQQAQVDHVVFDVVLDVDFHFFLRHD